MGGIWFNSLLSLPFKLTKTEVLICSRYVDADSQRYSCKNLFQNYAVNSHKEVTAGAFHLLLNCKRLVQVVWIPWWYFVTYATRSINIGTFKMFKQSFKIFKPEVLKATSFRRWNETVFQKFCDTYCLSKILFKNMSVLTHFELCAF